MQLAIKCLIGVAIFAAPCAYDAASREPSAIAGLVAAVSTIEARSERAVFSFKAMRPPR